MFNRPLMTATAAALITFASSQAWADPIGESSTADFLGKRLVMPGEFYGGIQGGVQWVDLPDFSSGTQPLWDDVNTDDGEVYGGNLLGGFGVDSDLGDNARVQVEGGFWFGDLDGDESKNNAGASYVSVDSTSTVGAFNIQTIHSELDLWDADIGVRAMTDFRTDTSVTLTPSIKLFGGYGEEDYDVVMTDNGGAGPFINTFEADVDHWNIGLEAALAGSVNVTDDFILTLAGRAGVVYFDADLDANDCADAATASPGCDGVIYRTSANDSLSKITYQGGASLALSYDAGGVQFGLMGNVDYLPFAEIDNPSFVGDDPSNLDMAHQLRYGAMATVTVPFN